MEEKEEKLLPIGTVVLLKGGEKRILITGYYVIDTEKKDTIYDYCGCPFPEGVKDNKTALLFDREQVEKIFHLGYSDEESEKVIDRIERYKNLLFGKKG